MLKWPVLRFEVSGDSMSPQFESGDRVVVFCWVKIQPGNVIVFAKNGLRMIKRAIQKNAERWTVRGDNYSASTDSLDFGYVSEEEIIGRVVRKY